MTAHEKHAKHYHKIKIMNHGIKDMHTPDSVPVRTASQEGKQTGYVLDNRAKYTSRSTGHCPNTSTASCSRSQKISNAVGNEKNLLVGYPSDRRPCQLCSRVSPAVLRLYAMLTHRVPLSALCELRNRVSTAALRLCAMLTHTVCSFFAAWRVG